MNTNIFIWNVRDLNSPVKQREVMLVCNKSSCGLVVLLETKLRFNKLVVCHRKFFSRWRSIENCEHCPTVMVWVLWRDEEFEVQLMLLDSQFIHLKVYNKATSREFFFTTIYATNVLANRLRLWDQLRELDVQTAWLLGGYFNNIMRLDEREGGSTPQIQEYGPFSKFVEDCGLEDMRSKGHFFTWSNGTIRSKIDKTLVNVQWIAAYPQVDTIFTAERLCDHTPLCVLLTLELSRRRTTCFRYCNMWSKDSSFLDIVQRAWQKKLSDFLMFQVLQKLKMLRRELRRLKKKYSAALQKVDDLKILYHCALMMRT